MSYLFSDDKISLEKVVGLAHAAIQTPINIYLE